MLNGEKWNQQHGDQEGKQCADSGKPCDLSPVIHAQQFASFSAGDEHQQQQSQPVDKRQNNIEVGDGRNVCTKPKQPSRVKVLCELRVLVREQFPREFRR